MRKGSVKKFSQISLQTLAQMKSASKEGIFQGRLQVLHVHVLLVAHWVPAAWRSRAQASTRADELPSGKLPTTRVRRRYRSMMAGSKELPLDLGTFRVTSPEVW